MRTLFDGVVPVAYAQVYVTARGARDDEGDMSAAFAGQHNGLCGAASPGGLFLITGSSEGWVRFTVEWHDGEPPPPAAVWEEVVEASFTAADTEARLESWSGERWWPLDLDPGEEDGEVGGSGYRVRYCATRMDEGHEADLDANRGPENPGPDRYLLQFWPAPPGGPRPDRVLRQTSATAAYWHDEARRLPPPPTPQQRAEANRRARKGQLPFEEAIRRREQERWGGREPTDQLQKLASAALDHLLHVDVDLVYDLAAADPHLQRRVAVWAARHAFAGAGIPHLDWLAPAWRSIGNGEPLPDVLADFHAVWHRIVGSTPVIEQPDGPAAANNPLPTNLDAAPAAVMALILAAAPDPLEAAIESLFAATHAHSRDRTRLFAEIRQAFPDLLRPPAPPTDP